MLLDIQEDEHFGEQQHEDDELELLNEIFENDELCIISNEDEEEQEQEDELQHELKHEEEEDELKQEEEQETLDELE